MAASNISLLKQLGSILKWEPKRGLLLLWAFFDDSNIHDPGTGHVIVTGLGGAFMTYERSLLLQQEWRAVLDSEHVETFVSVWGWPLAVRAFLPAALDLG